jgi:DNA repair protein RAD5
MRDASGRPIVVLPPKHISVVNVPFSNDEREIYTALYRNARSKWLGYQREGTVGSCVSSSFSLLSFSSTNRGGN